MKIEIDVPDGKQGSWSVETFTVSEDDASLQNVRATFSFSDRGLFIQPGTYKRLCRNGAVIMSNTPSELNDLYPLYHHREGDILLNGLGLGCALKLCLESYDVNSVTVIEIDKDVIELVGKYYTDPRAHIINADAYAYKPPKGSHYHAAWHDVWDNITSENLEGMKKLHRKYGKICDWQSSWKRAACELAGNRERRWEKELAFFSR